MTFADPENQAWPIDTEKHVHAALAYYNAGAGREKHSAEEWAEIGNRIAEAATAHYGVKHTLEGGKIVSGGGEMPSRKDAEDREEELTEHAFFTVASLKAYAEAAGYQIEKRLASAAETIKHCGDYGDLYWNAGTKTVCWNMGDADGGDGYSTSQQIGEVFGAVPGVEHVEIMDEGAGKDQSEGWVQIDYDRSMGNSGGSDIADQSGVDALAVATSAADIEAAGKLTHATPSEAQKAAGNYRKGRVNIQGLTVAIEVPRGGTRSGTAKDGTAWSIQMKDAYGYICTGADGADGDKVDCFLGDDPTSDWVFVIDQVDPSTGEFDEHKVVLGAASESEARAIYLRNYEDGWKGLGAITEMNMAAFKAWLKSEDCGKPVSAELDTGTSREGAKTRRDAKKSFYCDVCASAFEAEVLELTECMPDCPKCGSNSVVSPVAMGTSTIDGSDGAAGDDVDPGSGETPLLLEDMFLVGDATEWTAVTDRKVLRVGELMRVRQLMSLSDAINENDRLYPGRVMRPAIDRAQPRVTAGAMIMELVHPEVVRSRSGRQQYVDNPDRKTARIDSLETLPNGEVWANFTVLDLPCGREVADAYNAKRPYGTSMRFVMQGHEAKVDGRTIDVADAMEIYNFDHVPNPAFPQTKRNWQMLTDSQRAEVCEGLGCGCGQQAIGSRQSEAGAGDLTPNPLPETGRGLIDDSGPPGEPAAQSHSAEDASVLVDRGILLADEAGSGAASSAVTPPAIGAVAADARNRRAGAGIARRGTRMKPLKDAINRLFGLIAAKADAKEIAAAREVCSQEVTLAVRSDEDVQEATEQLVKADEMIDKLTAVMGNATGKNGEAGWGSDLRENARTATAPTMNSGAAEATQASGAGMDAADAEFITRMRKDHEAKTSEDARRSAIKSACDAERANLGDLSEETKEYILSIVERTAKDAADVPSQVEAQRDAYSKMAAKARLEGGGYRGNAAGNTVNDPAAPGTVQTHVFESHPVFDAVFDSTRGTPPAYLAGVSRFLVAADDYVRRSNVQGAENPDSPGTRARRAFNLRRLIPIMDSYAQVHHGAKDAGEWFTRMDALGTGGERAFGDSVLGGRTADTLSDAVLASNLYNQPSILMAILIQKLWDSKMLQFVQVIGSEAATPGGAGWATETRNGGIGKVLRVPVEFRDYSNMSGYALQPIANYDPGYLVPENTAVNEVRFGLTWLSYSVQLRAVSLQISREAILGLGKGPAGYPAFSRGLWHMAHDMQLRIDKAIADEMWQIADEFGAVVVTAESPNYTNNSVYNSGGSITVNLNPLKAANATVVSGDASVTYGANIVAAIRLATSGKGSSTPYAGGATYITPACRPRTTYDLTSAGLITNATSNPFTVIQTGGSYAAPVMGYLDNGATPQIHNFASGAVANFAVDWNNGVVLFMSGYNAIINNSGVARDASSSTTQVTYSYITNFDDFLVNTTNYGTGISQEMYLNGVLTRIEKTSAVMAGSPRYNPPDLVLGSPVASTWITTAQKFWNWASPKATELFPTPEFYASQNELNFARSNVPSQVGDSRLLLTKNGSTKYGVDEPFTVRGPQFATDGTTGLPINREQALGYEYSVICTPQTQDQSSPPVVLNPVARTVMLR